MKQFQWKKNGREYAIMTAVDYFEKALAIQTPDWKPTKEQLQAMIQDACKDAVGHYNEAMKGKYSNNSNIVYNKEKFRTFMNDVWATYLNEKRTKAMLASK